MHIKEIIIDGFKSYAHKTVVSGFDPHFNAITGLNGSGKSNILDSICFVLGITNLSQVRAGNLSELVYKQGQAGVTKASVSVTFDNRDESSSPVGYEQNNEVTVTRQVLIGGKSKYLINGKIQTMSNVNNLFHSVQLNVNNPHFLIMQGRITKVLNMKPHEILAMVEEAAGTRMYETKKGAALKTMGKKQIKLDELNIIITEEITPTLERLRGEKQHYLKWSKNNADIERNERFVVAYDYYRCMNLLQSSKEDVLSMENEIKVKEQNFEELQNHISDKESEINKVSSNIDGDFEDNLKKLKHNEENLSKELVQITSAWQNCKAVAKDAEAEKNATEKLVTESEDAVTQKEQEIAADADATKSEKDKAVNAEALLTKLQEDYQNMCAGISSEQGEEGLALPERISQAHSDANTADARAKQAQMKITHLNKTVKGVEKDMKKEESSTRKLNATKTKAAEKVQLLQDKLTNLNFSAPEFGQLEDDKFKLENDVSVLRENVETLTAQLEGRLAFNYSDPVRGFDRSRVKGLVAKLVTVKIPKYSTALEVAAGGKLYQVVVDETMTGKALLSKGNLRRRVTIIPLDKISSRPITSATSSHASSIASKLGTSSNIAIELVGFHEEVRNAMEYVFGGTLIVDETKAANQICDATKSRVVTIEGDVYDPSGTISGGSRNNLGTTLSKLTELQSAMKEFKDKEARYKVVSNKWESLKEASKKFGKVNDDLELANAEYAAAEKHLSQTTYGMLLEKYNSMTNEIEEAKTENESMEKEKNIKWALYHELKEKEEDLTKQREDKLKNIESTIKKTKQEVAAGSKKSRAANTRSEKLVLELENRKADVVTAKKAVESADGALKQANADEIAANIKVNDQESLYSNAKKDLKEAEDQKALLSAEIKDLSIQRNVLVKKAESIELEKKKMSVRIDKLIKDKSNADRSAQNLQLKYTWIESEKEAFGKSGGDYDFDSVDVRELSSRLSTMQDEQSNLVKKINKKVMGMIEKAEGEYTELLRKKKVVENDKKKIQKVIEELDVKKKSELSRTWEKVNKDFGSIFSTLLPGASSKLEPPEGMEAWEGLEVKVAFGDTWKESLSELSGGQRSLLALSLILAMLLYKPAPMYILDEVDAALDLSHTQNIGNMLKTHFSQSQFIVVSLKEGMFNNANVIYRTKFVDGVSTVTKTIGSGAKSKNRPEKRNSFTNKTPARKKSSNRRNATEKENFS